MSHPLSSKAAALRAIAEGLRQVAEGFERLADEPPDEGAVDAYTSKRLPPGMSRRQFAKRCRELARAGVVDIGRCGRVWVAPRSLFDEHAPIIRTRTSAPPAAKVARSWSAEQALREAGARRGEP